VVSATWILVDTLFSSPHLSFQCLYLSGIEKLFFWREGVED